MAANSDCYCFNLMFILLSQTLRRSDTDVQNCCTCVHSQNSCERVSIFILQNTHRAEPTLLHFVKNWLVGAIRIIYTVYTENCAI